MSPRVALVFCAHHKPWLMMSTLITTLLQDLSEADLYVVYNVGDGCCAGKASYADYHRLAAAHGLNPQLSPFDERVRDVCRLPGVKVQELEFENDHSLDSGAWYKFIRTGRWRAYDYTLFLGEGTLFTRPTALSSMVQFASAHSAGVIAGGHEKRRLPKSLVLRYNQHRKSPGAMNDFHDAQMRRVFDIFCRDAGFREVFDQWPSDFSPETQNHVPDIWGSGVLYRLRNRVEGGRDARTQVQRRRAVCSQLDALAARLSVGWRNAFGAEALVPRDGRMIHVRSVRRPVDEVVDVVQEGQTRFHAVAQPEWFGCATNHLFSRAVLERFAQSLERHGMYDALEVPFAGTALEIVWGFVPAWMGAQKWFTDGLHRVRKQFATYRREDDAEGMASYINRYYRGLASVEPAGDAVVIKSLHRSVARAGEQLGQAYVAGLTAAQEEPAW